MADFGKINPEKAQAIINALKDGRINQNEMKQLGLTAAEAEELNKAFSSGQVEIGDFVLVNKGQTEKNGKKIQLSSTTRKKEEPEQSDFMATAKKVGKYVGAAVVTAGVVVGGVALATGAIASMPAWAPLALIAAGGVLLQSCAPENKVEAVQTQNMNLKLQDYSKQLGQIIDRLDNMNDTMITQYVGILDKLRVIIENQQTSEAQMKVMVEGIAEQLKQWLETIIQNQRDIRTDNNKNAQDILEAIKNIKFDDGDFMAKLAELMTILKQIKSVSESILDEIKKAKDDIKNTLNTNNTEVLNALAKLDEKDQASLNVLNEIKNMLNKFGKEGKAMAEAILVAIGKIDPSSRDYTAKLDAIINLLKKLDANNEERSKKVIDAISKLGVDVTGDLTAILNAINALPSGQQKDYTDILNAILDKINDGNSQNDANFKAVLAAISKLGVEVSGDLNAILNAIKALPASEQKDYTEVLNAILAKIKEGNSENDANFKAVIAKINDMGVNVTYGMNAILNAINEQPDYTEILNKILAKIEENKDKVSQNGKTLVEILAAMKDIQNNLSIVIEGDRIKVTCNCGCGGTHEGIIGDLNDLLG